MKALERTLDPQFEVDLRSLLERIYLKYNYDFRHYSAGSLRRTFVHALNRMEYLTLAILEEHVSKNAEVFLELLQFITIPTSEMFRDPSYFLSLREKVVPHLRTYPSLKIWVAGCSTGEEVYSLAILLEEEGLLERTTLYATDINPRSLEKASSGIFASNLMDGYAANYKKSGGQQSLSDYYRRDGESVCFHDSLKRNITFSDHSLVTDSVFSETHLISCRNVLIYFDRELQNRVFALFNESLRRRGFLGLGSHETMELSQNAKFFEPLVKKDRIFQKT